jgi:hypothetical protein
LLDVGVVDVDADVVVVAVVAEAGVRCLPLAVLTVQLPLEATRLAALMSMTAHHAAEAVVADADVAEAVAVVVVVSAARAVLQAVQMATKHPVAVAVVAAADVAVDEVVDVVVAVLALNLRLLLQQPPLYKSCAGNGSSSDSSCSTIDSMRRRVERNDSPRFTGVPPCSMLFE